MAAEVGIARFDRGFAAYFVFQNLLAAMAARLKPCPDYKAKTTADPHSTPFAPVAQDAPCFSWLEGCGIPGPQVRGTGGTRRQVLSRPRRVPYFLRFGCAIGG